MKSAIAVTEAVVRSDCSSKYVRRARSIRDASRIVVPSGQAGSNQDSGLSYMRANLLSAVLVGLAAPCS